MAGPVRLTRKRHLVARSEENFRKAVTHLNRSVCGDSDPNTSPQDWIRTMCISKAIRTVFLLSISLSTCFAQDGDGGYPSQPAPQPPTHPARPVPTECYEVHIADPNASGVYVVYELIEGEWIEVLRTPIQWQAQGMVMRSRYLGGNPMMIEFEETDLEWMHFRTYDDLELALEMADRLEQAGFLVDIIPCRLYPPRPAYPRP